MGGLDCGLRPFIASHFFFSGFRFGTFHWVMDGHGLEVRSDRTGAGHNSHTASTVWSSILFCAAAAVSELQTFWSCSINFDKSPSSDVQSRHEYVQQQAASPFLQIRSDPWCRPRGVPVSAQEYT